MLPSCAPSPVEPEGDFSAALEARAPGEDVTLRWTNPIPGARVYLRMTNCIGSHGGISPVDVECEAPDTGSLTIVGTFLDALYQPEYWNRGECGVNELVRYHSVSTTIDGATIRFRTETARSFFFFPSL